MKSHYISENIEDTKKIISELYNKIINRKNLLYGELGSGKTTLVKYFAELAGSKNTVTSPTFNILQTYKCKLTTIYHFDLYRLNSITELEETGFFEYAFIDNATIFIEWANKFNLEEIFDCINKIYLYILETNKRKIEVYTNGFNT